MILQQQLYSNHITVIDDVTGLSVAEIRGNELMIFGRGVTICTDQQAAIEMAERFCNEEVIVKIPSSERITNQINLF